MTHSEQRKQVREQVRWAAHASNSNVHLIGVSVHDISDKGIFLENTSKHKAALGDLLRVLVFPRGQGQGLSAAGVVCWTGHSDAHHCDGVGIEFDQPLAVGPYLD